MENKSKNTSEISQWIDNYLHISLDTEEYVEVRNFLILWNLFEAKWFKCNFKNTIFISFIFNIGFLLKFATSYISCIRKSKFTGLGI